MIERHGPLDVLLAAHILRGLFVDVFVAAAAAAVFCRLRCSGALAHVASEASDTVSLRHFGVRRFTSSSCLIGVCAKRPYRLSMKRSEWSLATF